MLIDRAGGSDGAQGTGGYPGVLKQADIANIVAECAALTRI